jgi:hypothetical protein
MPRPRLPFHRSCSQSTRDRRIRPRLEGLEERVLLYSALGDQWTFDSRITYSFMPDGTSVGGVPSALFQTLNKNYPTSSWELQIEDAASLWENVTNVNLALVPDGGEADGTPGNQQDDPRFGDIRIGAVPLAAGTLAITFDPPPANGGTDAGDILLNSNVNWQIGSNYDLMTVVAHEFGHSLGLGESTVSQAVMYGTYNGIKQALASDDIAGIQSIYGTRQFDQFNNAGQRDNTYFTATNINSFITSNAQIAIPSLDITTSGDSEWFFVNVPATTSGTMSVTVQSSNLSSLTPKLQVYSQSLSLIGQATATSYFGATISVTANVQSGEGLYFKVLAASGPGPIGGYGLLVNFGSRSQAPIQPPNTVVAQQPDQDGGATSNLLTGTASNTTGSGWTGLPILFQQGLLPGLGGFGAWSDGLSIASTIGGVFGLNSPDQSGDSDASVAIQNSSDADILAAQTSIQAMPLMSPGLLAAPAPAIVTSVAAGPAVTVLQAVDDALDQWISSNS